MPTLIIFTLSWALCLLPRYHSETIGISDPSLAIQYCGGVTDSLIQWNSWLENWSTRPVFSRNLGPYVENCLSPAMYIGLSNKLLKLLIGSVLYLKWYCSSSHTAYLGLRHLQERWKFPRFVSHWVSNSPAWERRPKTSIFNPKPIFPGVDYFIQWTITDHFPVKFWAPKFWWQYSIILHSFSGNSYLCVLILHLK